MKKLAFIIALAALAGCASAEKKKAAEVPKSIEPNQGMTESRKKGFGDAWRFFK